jgi:glutaredoxin
VKKWIVIFLVLVFIQKWDVVNDFFDPPQDYSGLEGVQVVMYSTQWCGYCAKTRQFLDKNRIAYHDFDIEKSTKARREYESLGGAGVPLLVVNKQIVHGYNPPQILIYLDQQ